MKILLASHRFIKLNWLVSKSNIRAIDHVVKLVITPLRKAPLLKGGFRRRGARGVSHVGLVWCARRSQLHLLVHTHGSPPAG